MSYIESNIETEKINFPKENPILENESEVTPPLFSNNEETKDMESKEEDFDNSDQRLLKMIQAKMILKYLRF